MASRTITFRTVAGDAVSVPAHPAATLRELLQAAATHSPLFASCVVYHQVWPAGRAGGARARRAEAGACRAPS